MNPSASPDAATPEGLAGQYLTFTLGESHYGVPILRVQEIRGHSQLTRIAGQPRHVLGVMNLRGMVVPVIDLRLKLGVPSGGQSALDVIIMVTIGDRVMGMVVDAVSDVLLLDDAQIVPPPDVHGGQGSSVLRGMAKTEDRLLSLLHVERALDLPAETTAAA